MVTGKLSQVSPDECSVSTITIYELHSGVERCRSPNSERKKVNQFLGAVHRLDFNAEAALQGAQIRSNLESEGNTIGPYDLLIAGHALALGLILVTGNIKEFGRIASLRVLDWSRSDS